MLKPSKNFLVAAVAALAFGGLVIASGAKAGEITVGAECTGSSAAVCNGDIWILTTSTAQGTPGSLSWTEGTGAHFGGFVLWGSASDTSSSGPPNVFSTGSLEGAELDPTIGETLTVYMTSQGLTYPTGEAGWLLAFGNVGAIGAGWSVTESVFLDDAAGSAGLYNGYNSNAACGGTSPCAVDTGVASINTDYGTAICSFILTGTDSKQCTPPAMTVDTPFSITEEYTITYTGGTGTLNANISASAVPEPASLSLLGSALLGFGMWRRRRSQKA